MSTVTPKKGNPVAIYGVSADCTWQANTLLSQSRNTMRKHFFALVAIGAVFANLESKLTEFSSSARAIVEEASILDFVRNTFPVPTFIIPSVPFSVFVRLQRRRSRLAVAK